MPIWKLENTAALAIHRQLEMNGERLARSLEKLATGKRILNAFDDAAGLALSTRLEAHIRSVQQSQRNAADAVSLVQVAEGGLNEINNMMLRLRELAVIASNGNTDEDERSLINIEVNELTNEIDRMAESSTYLGTKLLNGTEKELVFQVGPSNTDVDRISYQAGDIDVRTSTLGISDLVFEDEEEALEAIAVIDEAIQQAQIPRAKLGALHGRLHSVGNVLSIYEENLSEANSRIRDVDYPRETTEYVRASIQQEAAIAMLAQANQLPSHVLRLLDTRKD